ncbi:MAG: DUF362 domain-containing protein [Asgard group archaeon]|nr:DUF362 domain-containing protein [Asgard group archaeon]
MVKSKVYFYKNVEDLPEGYNEFFRRIAAEVENEEKVAIKIHFGAENNDTHINPEHLRGLPEIFKKPIFVESNCLYPGVRSKSKTHIALAREHGFSFLDIDILDGEEGDEYIEVEMNTKYTKNAKISTGLRRYKDLISVAHFKGHIAAGIGGAIKNLGMGIGARGGKLDMHGGIAPKADPGKCTACGICAENCVTNAITVEDYAIVDDEKCVGCAYCIGICPEKAFRVPFGVRRGKEFIEKITDYAKAATIGHNWWYINSITNITMKCDCMSIKQTPFMKDIGIVYSKDPLAIDKASTDLVTKYNNGINPFLNNTEELEHVFEYGQKIGLGSVDYELIEL